MKPTDYTVGMLVTHPNKPEWGPGKVLAVDSEAVTVYFRDFRETKPGESVKRIVIGKVPLAKAPNQIDPWLDNLPPWQGGKTKPIMKRWTQDQAIEAFLAKFPKAFQSEQYQREERNYKWAAHQRFVETLGNGQADQLLDQDYIEDLAKAVLCVVHKVNLLSPQENMALQDAMKNRDAARRFLHMLFEVLADPHPQEARFLPYIDAVNGLPAEVGRARVATWPILTIMPFLARPDSYMFLKPEVTKAAADRLHYNLNYSPKLNWLTYRLLLQMSDLLMEKLRPLGAQDLIDVQSFIWVTGYLE